MMITTHVQFDRPGDGFLHGDPSPSQADIQMTKAIIDIAKPLGISVHDHIIVGNERRITMTSQR